MYINPLLTLLLVAVSSAFSPSSHRGKSLTRMFSSTTAMLPEGVVKQTSTPGQGKAANLGDIATVKYTCYLADQDDASPFARSEKQKMVGWRLILG